jgi:mannose-6-phosphate isomerase-like protein (cupin superfamily)
VISSDAETLLATLRERAGVGELFTVAFTRGSVSVEMYAPRQADRQLPHAQDELYVVHRGTGEFVMAKERQTFSAGSVFFVPAGEPHRFENFSDDFSTWVIFFGPQGGEQVG